MSDRDAFAAHAEHVVGDFGGANVLINNAGVALVGELTEVSWEQIDWITGINVGGVLNGSKAFLPHLQASGDGHLVNMSSMWGLVGAPTGSHYCATKFFVRGLTDEGPSPERRKGRSMRGLLCQNVDSLAALSVPGPGEAVLTAAPISHDVRLPLQVRRHKPTASISICASFGRRATS